MGIDPDDTQLFVFCRAADRTDRQAVVSAKYQWEAPALNRCRDRAGDAPPHRNDAVDVFELRVGDLAGFLDRHFDVAFIFERISQFSQFLMKMCISYRAGPHIHATAVCAEINGNANNVNLHKGLRKGLTTETLRN